MQGEFFRCFFLLHRTGRRGPAGAEFPSNRLGARITDSRTPARLWVGYMRLLSLGRVTYHPGKWHFLQGGLSRFGGHPFCWPGVQLKNLCGRSQMGNDRGTTQGLSMPPYTPRFLSTVAARLARSVSLLVCFLCSGFVQGVQPAPFNPVLTHLY